MEKMLKMQFESEKWIEMDRNCYGSREMRREGKGKRKGKEEWKWCDVM